MENILGNFYFLQKFPSITEPKAVFQEFSNEDLQKVTTTFKVKTEVTLLGERKIRVKKDVEEQAPDSTYVSSASQVTTKTSLREVAEIVDQLNYGCRSTPKQLWYVPPEKRKAVYDLTQRICELYKVTDRQVAEAPLATRAICWLTNNSFFPEYRLRQRLEKGEYTRPMF